MASEASPVEQGQDFATSTGTLDREDMSELSDISTDNVATKRSPFDNTMMNGVTEKPATSSSFWETSITMVTGTGDEAELQEEEEDNDEQDDFESQISLNSSTQDNDAYTNRETGSTD